MSSKPLTVLLVDDDPIVRHLLQRWSTEAGFQADTAEDGADALAKARQHPPDLLVTDLHMPRMHGSRLVALVRTLPEMTETPIMVVTADASRGTKVELLQGGADDFILKPVDREEFIARLRAHARRCGMSEALAEARQERDDALAALRERADELERLTFGLVSALEKANSLNDEDTGNHIRRVSELAGVLARALGCPPEFIAMVRRYAGLHDIGKVGIPDAILKKPGKLTAEEFEEMKAHTLIGAEVLRAAGLPLEAIHIPLCHHERWDGTGYPCGLRGEQIPLEARIVAVVDVYDALRSRRCYKPAFSFEQAAQILRESAGSHMEPQLVEMFLRQRDAIAQIEASYGDELPVEDMEQLWA